ncbi:MAG: hypothetical protein ACRCXZ_08530 [Patescibacteria group bacterium]
MSLANLKMKFAAVSTSKKQIVLITTLLLITKFFGLIRQSYILAIANSGSIQADIFVNSTRIQDLIISFMLTGTILSTMIPIGAKFQDKEDVKFIRWFRDLFLTVLGCVCAVVMVLMTHIDFVITTLTPNNPQYYTEYVASIQVLLIGVIFFTLSVLYQTFLNLKQKFFWQNVTGMVSNILVTLPAIYAPQRFGWYGSVAITVSFAINALILGVSAHKSGLGLTIYNPLLYFKSLMRNNFGNLIGFAKASGPKLLLISPFLVIGLLVQRFSGPSISTYFETSLNILNLYGIILISLGLVTLPKFSFELNSTVFKDFRKKIVGYLGSSIKFGLYGTIVMMFASDAVLIMLKFLSGGITAIQFDSNYWLISISAKILSLTVISQTCNEIFYKYFMAREKNWILLTANSIAILISAGIFLIGTRFNINQLYLASIALVFAQYASSGVFLYFFAKDKKI